MDCRSKRDFNLDDDEDLGDDYDHDDHSRLMDFRPKQDFNFNFLPTALEWEEECQFVNWRIGERTFPEWVNLSLLTCLSLGESENWRIGESGLICPPSSPLTCLSLGPRHHIKAAAGWVDLFSGRRRPRK